MSIEVPIHYQNNLMDNFQNKKRNRSNEITWSFEEEFEVEMILGKRIVNDKHEYLLKLKG